MKSMHRVHTAYIYLNATSRTIIINKYKRKRATSSKEEMVLSRFSIPSMIDRIHQLVKGISQWD